MRKQSNTLLAVLAAGIVALCGCAAATPETVVITQVVEVTLTAMPEPTATPTVVPTAAPTETPVPLGDINLEPLLIQPGDLPPGYTASQIRMDFPEFLRDAPEPQGFLRQLIDGRSGIGGSVQVLLYDSLQDVDAALLLVADTIPDPEVSDGYGEKCYISSTSIAVRTASFAFSRCHAVVLGTFIGTSSIGAATSYAMRLDARLEPVVCRD